MLGTGCWDFPQQLNSKRAEVRQTPLGVRGVRESGYWIVLDSGQNLHAGFPGCFLDLKFVRHHPAEDKEVIRKSVEVLNN